MSVNLPMQLVSLPVYILNLPVSVAKLPTKVCKITLKFSGNFTVCVLVIYKVKTRKIAAFFFTMILWVKLPLF